MLAETVQYFVIYVRYMMYWYVLLTYTGGELQITVLATGFEEGNARRGRRSSTAK